MIKQRIISSILVLLLIFAYPASVWAATDDPASTTSDTSATDSAATTSASEPAADPPVTENSGAATSEEPTGPTSTPGPTQPNGSDGDSYVYNEQTGLWENDYYTWDPITHQTKPKKPQTYSYNPVTGMWDTTEWIWDAPLGKYVPNTKSVKVNPLSSLISGGGPNSTNNINNLVGNTNSFNLFYNASISNSLFQNAGSGNAGVLENTIGGSAFSGNATDMINILNMISTIWNLQPANFPVLFNANINGDVTGDLLIDPSLINNTGPGSNSAINSSAQNNLTVNVQGSGSISNDINLTANSGDATVFGNTQGGDAASGNAQIIANIVNILNSVISAGQSFIGNININGNLDGDILLPPNFLDLLISSGAPQANVSISSSVNNTINADLNSNQSINNNTNLQASSGDATVEKNTNAGTAITGNSETNLTLFNLTNRSVVGTNTLLVFVNVLGKWVGLMVDAPSGSNTAAFCGGSCQIGTSVDNNVAINENTDQSITNNLKANANSGDATVSSNTNAGNATSGNASVGANILNIANSQFSTSNWFGILFINVFGSWKGSFGLNTEAGTLFANSGNASGGNNPADNPAVAKVFKFVAEEDNSFAVTPLAGGTGGESNTSQSQGAAATSSSASAAAYRSSSTQKYGTSSWLTPVIAVSTLLMVFAVAGAIKLSDKLWILSISRANRTTKKIARKSFSLRQQLSDLTWKLPLF